MFWKKIMSTALCAALLVTHAGMARAAVEETVQGKLAAVEEETWGGTQTGALVDRINRLEKDYLGIHNNGSMLDRINIVYDDIYENAGGPGLLTQLNAVEWGLTHEVNPLPIDKRVTDMEMFVEGKTNGGTYKNRIQSLGTAAFGGYSVPLQEVTVPQNTIIKIVLTDNVNAKKLKVGDTIHYKVAEDVVQNGMLVFAKGQPGVGTVKKVRQARNFGRDAEIETDFHTTKAMDGTDVTTFVGEEAKKELKSYALAAGASVAGMLLLGPIGIIGGAFVKGKNIELPAGTELFIQTKNDTVLYAVPTTEG